MVCLHWTQAALLYWLAFIGLWHIIGIPPIMQWRRKR